MNNNNEKKLDLSHLLFGLGGTILGTWLIKNQIEESKKSRAERDHPEDVAEVSEEIATLLNDWTPDDCENEDEYTQDLFEYLYEDSEWEVEIRPNTIEGYPDILIADLLALELKLNPNKVERDRLIGQCAGYSRQWVTWAIIIDSSASQIGKLENLLVDKGLEHILVLPYN
jgi:hypothetical protein